MFIFNISLTADFKTNLSDFILESIDAFMRNKVYLLWPLEIKKLRLWAQSF